MHYISNQDKLRKMKKKPSKKKLTTLSNKLWTLISRYVRMYYADEWGMVNCYTCSERMFWSRSGRQEDVGWAQAGHCFTQGAHKATKFDLDNIRPQCYKCNINNGGQGAIFRGNLQREHGMEWVNALERKAKQSYRGDAFWLEEQIKIYKEKVKEIRLLKGL